MARLTILLIGVLLSLQEIPICRPLKEDESYTLKTLTSIQIGANKVLENGKFEHKCIEVDDHEIEHIEVTCTEGTRKRGDEEAESTKGETYNYFQNAFGQRFEYEEIRATLKDNPIQFIIDEIHSKLKDHTVVPGETWSDKSAHTGYTITVGQPKKFMDTECIPVTRKGVFTAGMSGTFKEETWYRTSDGQLMYQQTTADDVAIPDVEPIQYLERSEFIPPKK